MRAAFPFRFLTGLALSLCAALPAAAVESGGFSLVVPQGEEDQAGYVRLRDGQVYEICFGSSLDRRSDVSLSVDGLPMGVFRLEPYGNWCVQRPQSEDGRFTFYRAESAGGIASGSASVKLRDRGILRARFTPEKQEMRLRRPEPAASAGGARPEADFAAPPPPPSPAPAPAPQPPGAAASESELSSGVTGLTGRSGQSFRDAERLDLDPERAVVLELRLVHDSALEPAEQPRPLPGRFDRLAPPPILR